MIPMLLIAFFIVVLDITGFKLDEDFSNIMYDMEDGVKEEKPAKAPSSNANENNDKLIEKDSNPEAKEDKQAKEEIPNDADSLLEEIYGKGKK